uniref:Uncharacterized protein n=1 Tax=Romanomermis culicivorax TaxID=13658 RepID=A0A915L0L4_ROMCU
ERFLPKCYCIQKNILHQILRFIDLKERRRSVAYVRQKMLAPCKLTIERANRSLCSLQNSATKSLSVRLLFITRHGTADDSTADAKIADV